MSKDQPAIVKGDVWEAKDGTRRVIVLSYDGHFVNVQGFVKSRIRVNGFRSRYVLVREALS